MHCLRLSAWRLINYGRKHSSGAVCCSLLGRCGKRAKGIPSCWASTVDPPLSWLFIFIFSPNPQDLPLRCVLWPLFYGRTNKDLGRVNTSSISPWEERGNANDWAKNSLHNLVHSTDFHTSVQSPPFLCGPPTSKPVISAFVLLWSLNCQHLAWIRPVLTDNADSGCPLEVTVTAA